MEPYRKMYLCLFNAITDALRELEKENLLSARSILQFAQQQTEEMFISAENTEQGKK